MESRKNLSEGAHTAAADQRVEYVSLAPLFGENSMEAFTRALLEDRHCMDCDKELEDFEGYMEFSGQPPYVELIGHFCEACWERWDKVRRYRT